MRDYKLGTFPESEGSKERSHRPKIKGFGYQVLGFGAGGGFGPPIDFQYLVVAAGGAGSPSGGAGGGGGAGGSRTSFPGGTAISLLGGPNEITIGTGGYGMATPVTANSGSVSELVGDNFTIESSGGGGGAGNVSNGVPGGSGSGCGSSGGFDGTGGSGNAGGYSPNEGNPGGNNYDGVPHFGAGGGGGHGGTGSNGSSGGGGSGGSGTANSISGSPVTYAGGGGGSGGGGAARNNSTPNQIGYPGTNGLGGGAGGGNGTANTPGGSPVPNNTNTGGDGVVILRCPGAEGARLTVLPGTNTKVTLPGSDVVCTFTVSGTLKIA